METTIQYLQIATDIIIILLFIGLVILVFTLIKTLKYFSVKIEEMSVQVKDIKSTMNPAIDKFQDLTENVNGVFLKVRDNIDVLTTVVEKSGTLLIILLNSNRIFRVKLSHLL